ncbi:hypothetical protein [Streptomyces sp. NPDC056821]|uniref:hypothetical protein n=1 Tax=unclassified Streptomyces TaxID=2593676 RepID=UPI0036CAB560
MDRKATAPARAVPGCAECTRLKNQRETAEKENDYSRVSDCRVLLARHRADAHGVDW